MASKPTHEELKKRIKKLGKEIISKSNQIQVSDINIEWNVKQGTCNFENLPVAMMWVDTTLAGLMSGVQAMVGTKRFGLALQSEGRKSVVQDWQVISQFSDFKDGFKAIANIAAVAGWGDWTLISMDENKKECQFRVKGSWEGLYQKSIGVCWGSGMLAGKMAGYCSKLFNTNCWAKQTAFIARGEKFDEFLVKPSKRCLEKEIDNLLATDEATRADMAVALQKLQKEISERMQIEGALRESEEKYRSMMEAMVEPAYICSSNFIVSYMNPAMVERTGRDATGELCYKAINDLDEQCPWCAHDKIQNGESDETVIVSPKDHHLYSISRAPIFHNDGSISKMTIYRDITDLKRAEEALRKSEKKYRLLVESTHDWVWMCDLESRITFSNNAVKEILGYEIHEILGTSAVDLIHKEDRKSIQKWFQKAKKQKRGWKGSVIRWQHKDKSIRFLETIAEPILDDKDNLIGYLGIDRDVTVRKLSEMALKKAHDELQEKTKRLEIQKNSLEELNTAMKVLLKKREEDKTEIESNVLTNVKELIEPYFEKIEKTKLDDQQRALLSIMESNINEIVSPFTRKMSMKYLNLTPTEIRIANLIRHGGTTKKIAEILHISPKTVETHRKNIRRKIGIDHKRANLRSHLLSLH
jgi:PAS domain S-box-containing protein